ncbi:phage tail spike protein [Cohnella sp. GbtcB17]|uniref:phage tail spike protein n=1 Tax=Cohnella sp. GbtcB17 TaxID=2824762 RepID=UPI001C304595|nr:phage tail spike protein [Cohnella sp. GbtcB17]
MRDDKRSRLEIWTSAGRLGILANAFNVRVREVLNGEYYVTFTYPREEGDERYDTLVEDNDVAFPSDVERGQRFRIRSVQEVRDGLKMYKLVEAHHVAFSLGDYFLDSYIDFAAAKTIEEMLGILGADTPYTFAVEGAFAAQDVWEWGEDKRINLLQQLRTLYNAELYLDNYEITLTTRAGGNYGARVRYKHNMKGIKRNSHNMEQITRLYGYGKDGLTIEGYGGRTVKYIDSPYFDPARPKMGKVEFADIDDQGKLLQEMQKYLAKYEQPNVSYDVDFVQLEKVDPDFRAERIRGAGDTVTVRDDVLGYSFDARVQEFERYPFEKRSGSVVLSNFRQLTTADYIFQATVGSKKAISYTSRNAVLKGVKYDDSLTLVDGLGLKVTDDHNVERVRLGQIGPGIYGMWVSGGAIQIGGGLPDSQVAGATNWNGKTTLLTSAGIYTGFIQAEQIVVNNLSAISADLGTVTAGSIFGVYINGTNIDGGTITGALIRTAASGSRIEFSNTSALLRAFYTDSRYISINPLWGSGPGIQFDYDGTTTFNLLMNGPNVFMGATNGLTLQAPSGITIAGGWSNLVASGGGGTLQSALDGKMSASKTFSLSLTNIAAHNHGIPDGTQLRKADGTAITFNAYDGYTGSYTIS